MTDQQDRIRVWNEETGEMMEPVTVQEMLCMERNTSYIEHVPEDYGHLVFMRNTGIYAAPNPKYVNSAREEVFAEDLITHSIEPYVYRVVQKRGCWWAMSLLPDKAQSERLIGIIHPIIVGNVFENRELFTKGEIIDE